MNLDGFIIGTGQQQFSIVAVVEASDGSIMSLDCEGVSFCVVGPNLDCLVFWCACQLISQRRELDVSHSILNLLWCVLYVRCIYRYFLTGWDSTQTPCYRWKRWRSVCWVMNALRLRMKSYGIDFIFMSLESPQEFRFFLLFDHLI